MASVVDICNLALAHLGDEATVSSIDPPEGSAQAEHCARFYPMARDTVLEAHDWNFATTRGVLALVGSAWPSWAFCYELPATCVRAISVLPPGALDDYSTAYPRTAGALGYPGATFVPHGAVYTPQEFSIETGESDGSEADDRRLLYTNQEGAVLRYTRRVEDTTRFPPLFVDALTRLLASYLAGPVVKGTDGVSVAQAQLQAYRGIISQATVSDSNQRSIKPRQSVPWIAGR
ncbi:hypothetical protein [Achromobacter pestifer]|uniref:Uncharacterized protein n=1 Tax=Achromobacter pestifer TaxID=1353889 RepID=A0A6S6YJX9_9BURK|nr:hypothetical protein [Achromobacter pestifer]CAB3624686.1 hypothetical protein LMG3431_00052 [Achromobacter pestifer]